MTKKEVNILNTNKKHIIKTRDIIGIIFLSLIIVSPIIWMIYLSVKPAYLMFDTSIRFPMEITFDNYKSTLNLDFIKSIMNSFIIGGVTAIVSILLGAPAAYTLAFSQWSLKVKEKYMSIILLLRMASPIAFAIPIFLVYSKLHLIDTHLGLIMAYLTFTLPLVVWLLWMFFLDIPVSILEAGMVDGASVFQRFTKIVLPLGGPGIIAAGILSFGACWNDFFFSLVLTRNEASTGTVAVINFLKYSGYDWGGVTSASVLLILPALPIAYFMQKYMAQGLTSGAVKQ